MKSLATLQDKQNQMDDVSVKRYDDLQFILALNLKLATSKLHSNELKIHSRIMMLSWLLVLVLLLMISINLIIDHVVLLRQRQKLNSELAKIFLVYPPDVVQENVYLVNFFELRRFNLQ